MIFDTHMHQFSFLRVYILRIAQQLGHTSPKTTLEFFSHLLPNANNDIADIFHNSMQKDEKEE